MQTWLLNVLWPTQYLTRKLNEFLCFQYNRRHTWKARSFTAFLAFCRCEQLNFYVGAGWVALAWVELTSGVKMPSWLGRCCNTEHNSRAPATEIWTAELNAALVQSPSPSLGWALSLPFCAYLPSWSSTNSCHCTSSQKCWVQYSCEAVCKKKVSLWS